MHLFDMHCDTLYRAVQSDGRLDKKDYEVKPDSGAFKTRLQCYAIWLPDDLSGDAAEKTVLKAANVLRSECKRLGISLLQRKDDTENEFYKNRLNAFFTVENALALNEKIENVELFSRLGVRMMTLTWNGKNPLGSGAAADDDFGLSSFGKRVIEQMERHGIAVDISHASDKLFYDAACAVRRPFVASHSNSRAVTAHRRNLTDEQFKLTVKRGGLVGLNFCRDFLNDNPDRACAEDIFRHAYHFLSLGGEDTICFGSDFDGCDLPADISSDEKFGEIYEIFLRQNIKESIIQKIFYKNAVNFFENFDIR